MSTKLDFLNKIPYFSGLSTTELESISKLIVEKKADKGEMLLFEGQAARALYFINSGTNTTTIIETIILFKISGNINEAMKASNSFPAPK